MEKDNTITLKVAGNSSVRSVAGSITKCFEDGMNVEVTAIGAGAVNQATKSIAMARSFIATKGKDLYSAPGFCTLDIDGNEKTAIRFTLKLL
jgi:stage V sporulation protein S